MLTMGLDIGSRSAKCVILDDGQLLTYGAVETGPDSARTAYVAVDAAVHRRSELWGESGMPMPDVRTDHLRIEDMACIVATGYGRAVVPFAHGSLTEISCHGRGARWLVPGVRTILDMGGQDCKAIRVNDRGEVTRFVMNDKCAGGTGRFMEIIADALNVPLFEIGALSLTSTKAIAFSRVCAVYAKSEAMAFMRQGVSKVDILAGLHDAISTRVVAMLRRVGIEHKFVITGGIARNVGVVTKIGEKLGGIEITLPAEPMIAGALGAALFAFDRARKDADPRHPWAAVQGAKVPSASRADAGSKEQEVPDVSDSTTLA
jgi:predicted CoA-substrate-specific enzyme activase